MICPSLAEPGSAVTSVPPLVALAPGAHAVPLNTGTCPAVAPLSSRSASLTFPLPHCSIVVNAPATFVASPSSPGTGLYNERSIGMGCLLELAQWNGLEVDRVHGPGADDRPDRRPGQAGGRLHV